ncbi:MAG: hypothetical protein CUN55_05540 [Phototrophicales bacterium]|nr:MAG: hypothetical protein CUN55_05540 [Phototrophicales bacterium]
MIRTVPNTGSEDIVLYMRTYYSLLRTSDAIKIQSLTEAHAQIDSSLHVHAHDDEIDISALVYSTLRLPVEIIHTKLVVLAQLIEDFRRIGLNVEEWEQVYAIARRRRVHFDGKETLAVMITSRSDIDDLVPILTALQIEWNKVHQAFVLNSAAQKLLKTIADAPANHADTNVLLNLAQHLGLEVSDLSRLQSAWKSHFISYLNAMAERPLDLSLQLLAGSQMKYRKAANRWWDHLNDVCETRQNMVANRAIYFVSSNTHAIPNLLAGYAQQIQPQLTQFMHELRHADLLAEWENLQNDFATHVHHNFFYYLLKKYQTQYPKSIDEMYAAEQSIGLTRIPPQYGFDIEAQVIELNKVDPNKCDPRIREGLAIEQLKKSDALIINIDYPLGLAAFELLSRVVEGTDAVLGIYIMGKAATLNGRIGDVMLANVVHDEHSQNTYLFNNCLKASDITPHLVYGTVLDNQKAITARGTFLQNRTYMDVFYREGYTILEMEAGPYLSAVYEMIRPQRHPYNEIANLYPAPFNVGLAYYASDTPYSRGHNLGAGSLGYKGMDATYSVAIAILRKIFQHELQRITN